MKNFAKPEMEVIRFNAQEIVTATSCQPHSMGINDDPISGGGGNGCGEIIYGG